MSANYVDSYFYHNIFYVSQSQLRMVRVSKGSNKRSSAFKLFQFCYSQTQHRFKNKSTTLKDYSVFWSTVWAISSKLLKKRASAYKFHYRNQKLRLDLESQNSISAQYYNDIKKHPNGQNLSSFRFENNNFCVFSIKTFELHGSQFVLTKIVKLNHRQKNHLYKKKYYVANNCEIIERHYNM